MVLADFPRDLVGDNFRETVKLIAQVLKFEFI
jgi:hypothetical protein